MNVHVNGIRSVEVEVIRQLSVQVGDLRGLVNSLREQMAGLRSEVASFKRDIIRSMVGVKEDTDEAAILDIVTAACREFGCGYKDILSTRRSEASVKARRAVYLLAREMTGHSLPAIGRALRKDHSTVLHGIRRAEELVKRDPLFADAVNKVRAAVRGKA